MSALETDRTKILRALTEKPLKLYAVMQRANIQSEDECRETLLKMRDDGLVTFSIKTGRWGKAQTRIPAKR